MRRMLVIIYRDLMFVIVIWLCYIIKQTKHLTRSTWKRKKRSWRKRKQSLGWIPRDHDDESLFFDVYCANINDFNKGKKWMVSSEKRLDVSDEIHSFDFGQKNKRRAFFLLAFSYLQPRDILTFNIKQFVLLYVYSSSSIWFLYLKMKLSQTFATRLTESKIRSLLISSEERKESFSFSFFLFYVTYTRRLDERQTTNCT